MSAMISIKMHAPGAENVFLTIELLRNGEAWGEDIQVGNPYFRFGKVKAQLILASWDLIEEYVGSVGAKPPLFHVQERYVPDAIFVTAKVVKQSEFINRAGILVEKHYLQFTYGEKVWGFGLSKAQALLSYQKQIDFVAKS